MSHGRTSLFGSDTDEGQGRVVVTGKKRDSTDEEDKEKRKEGKGNGRKEKCLKAAAKRRATMASSTMAKRGGESR